MNDFEAGAQIFSEIDNLFERFASYLPNCLHAMKTLYWRKLFDPFPIHRSRHKLKSPTSLKTPSIVSKITRHFEYTIRSVWDLACQLDCSKDLRLIMASRELLRRTRQIYRWRRSSALSRQLSNNSSKHDSAGDQTTHFGFSEVPLSSKPEMVNSVFSSVASRYDLMNDLMSLRVHRLWKDAFVSDISPSGDMRILDCAGGTGDIAERIDEHVQRHGGWTVGGVTVCDASAKMVEVGRQRLSGRAEFLVGDAENLPFEEQFDVYTISFGMRNVSQPDVALQEAFRVLKPGGRFMMLEFGQVDNPLIGRIYDMYSFGIIPRIGSMVTGDEASYRYLVESIRKFPGQEEFLGMVRDAGFINCRVNDYSFGIAAVYSGFKPIS